MPMYDSISLSWLMKSTPVAYSVRRPTPNPNMTHRPLKISLFLVQPNTLHDFAATYVVCIFCCHAIMPWSGLQMDYCPWPLIDINFATSQGEKGVLCFVSLRNR